MSGAVTCPGRGTDWASLPIARECSCGAIVPPASPSPTPWRPDGEGWDTYRLGDVRGLAGWEVGAIRGGRLAPATDEHADRIAAMPDHAVVYARPIPEPPIKVGDRVRIDGDEDPAVVLAIDDDMAWIRWTAGLGTGARVSSQLSSLHRLPDREPRP